MGGLLGMDVSLEKLPGAVSRDDFALYSESQGRVVVTVAPQYQERFEQRMLGNACAQIGVIRSDPLFMIRNKERKEIIRVNLENLLEAYREQFRGF